MIEQDVTSHFYSTQSPEQHYVPHDPPWLHVNCSPLLAMNEKLFGALSLPQPKHTKRSSTTIGHVSQRS
ncbi:uncharacterized [Tachysurus ichikawai]